MSPSQRFRELLYRLRTEGGSPGQQAAAVALGVVIGCTPFYGLHFLLCVVFARLLRLNRALTYLAAHVSIPGTLPILLLGEVQLGRWLRGAPFLSIHLRDLKTVDLWQFGADLLVGSTIIGVLLAIPLAALTWWAAHKRLKAPAIHDLIEETAYRYLDGGMFDWEFVRGKLRHDPVYLQVLQRGLLPPDGLLLDLGCGRGIFLALLLTARERAGRGLFVDGWPPPPHPDLYGIESSAKAAKAARGAVGDLAHIEAADLRQADLPPARAVLLLDVLHYLPAADQEDLLGRVARALEPGGLFLIRDADADAGWRFTATRLQERASALARRRWRQRFHYRGAAEWRRLVEAAGFAVEQQPMAMGTPYANVLLVARRA